MCLAVILYRKDATNSAYGYRSVPFLFPFSEVSNNIILRGGLEFRVGLLDANCNAADMLWLRDA